MACIVRFHEYGDASVLKIENLDVPPPDADEVQIDVKSIGFNRAEVMFRMHAFILQSLQTEVAMESGIPWQKQKIA